MKTAVNKELIRRFVEEIENTGDVSTIGEFIDENYVEIYEGKPYPVGIQGAIDHVLGVRRVHPDMKMTIENQIAEDDWVVTVYTVRGTFENEWFGMKPNGKMVKYTGVNVDKIKDGKIVEHGGAANLLDPLLKAGAVKKTTK